jgi:hypothetical protein
MKERGELKQQFELARALKDEKSSIALAFALLWAEA